MALDLADRILTIVVTATLTSAAWIVVGTTDVDRIDKPAPTASPSPGTAVASPTPQAPAPSPAVAPSGPLLIPVAGVAFSQLSDTFNQTRGGERRHEALDIMAPAGTPVLAAAGGTVEKLFKSDAGGNTVYVRSPDKTLIYYYAHLDSYAPGLAEGQAVRQGQRLGSVGISGNVDPAGPHLHFEVQQTTPQSGWWQHTVSLNPYPLLGGR